MGFIETLLGGRESSSSSVLPQAQTTKTAVGRLEELSKGPFPDVPLRGIADLPDQTPIRALARSTATDLAKPREDRELLDLPEVQAIIKVATDAGNLETNRLGRILQASGNLTSTTGRDVLGKSVGDIRARITERLAPLAAQERGFQEADVTRRQNLIPTLERLGFIDEAATQENKQAQLDAIFAQETTESRQIMEFLVPILQSIIQADPGVSSFELPGRAGLVGQVGAISSLASVVGPGISAAFPGGGTQTGGGSPVSRGISPPR